MLRSLVRSEMSIRDSFLTNKGLTVTNEKKALELHLFSGDVRKYGLAKALKRTDESVNP